MSKLRIVITAGPTREHLDSVRFISNPSSGKMGYAIADAAAKAGHRVVLVSGPVAIPPPPGIRPIHVTSAAEMATATKRAFQRADAAVLTAAVCDYRPLKRAKRKIAKNDASRTVELVPTEDIAASLGRIKKQRITVAFALEDHDARRHAEAKLRRKNCDAIILNGPENVGSQRASVEFLQRGGRWEVWPRATKQTVARRIVQRLERLCGK